MPGKRRSPGARSWFDQVFPPTQQEPPATPIPHPKAEELKKEPAEEEKEKPKN